MSEFPKGVNRIHLYNLDEELPEDDEDDPDWSDELNEHLDGYPKDNDD